MLNKKERLSKAEFDRSFSIGKRLHTPELQIIYHETADSSFKAAAVVGKKVFKGAVDRNRARRQLYGALREWRTATGATGRYIVIAKPKFKEVLGKQRIARTLAALNEVPKK